MRITVRMTAAHLGGLSTLQWSPAPFPLFFFFLLLLIANHMSYVIQVMFPSSAKYILLVRCVQLGKREGRAQLLRYPPTKQYTI
ncbi:hypothetical protein BDB00DRAFT_857445 [Zychaea mexicana]|uniref:uncharacterized protein n=1 Tax=Zychaea mexicana TaxID=64656 RepID=UPI0022FDBF25|nr:uncharacterized protein BDB00DRAFT_857445 [Zychaea mexicana]KAI9482565.1 hypothetical protein BDB00DRAFT_857445 [Zychaea mexicana]